MIALITIIVLIIHCPMPNQKQVGDYCYYFITVLIARAAIIVFIANSKEPRAMISTALMSAAMRAISISFS